jgi:predicted nucleic acid-binding protein
MKTIVIDLNVLMDFLFKRPGHEQAAEICGMCATGKITGLVCAHEITTLYYFLNKEFPGKRKIRKSIAVIMKYFPMIEINAPLLSKALNSEIADFEDAVIESSAQAKNADFILTRNLKDFKKSAVHAITPEALLAMGEGGFGRPGLR